MEGLFMERRLLRAAVACVVSALGACQAEPSYIGDGKLYQVALTEQTMPALEGEDGALYIVETRPELPVRAPSDAQLAALQTGEHAPFPRRPWVERDNVPLQIEFTLTNLDDKRHFIDVTFNGANEFFEYVPLVVTEEEELVPLHSQWEKRYELGPKQRLAATVREEETDEMAVDLATVVNGAPNSDEIVYFENNSQSDARARPFIPTVIPGLIALRMGLRATEASNVLLEASVRVRDVGDKLASGDEPLLVSMPVQFQTVLPEN
jgi:hypothetical protein